MLNLFWEKIDLSYLNIEDRTYLFSFPKRKDLLLESIKRCGVLQPPIVYLKEDESFQIVCGEGRVLACQTLEIKKIPVLILKNKSPKDLLLLSLESNLFRNLNLVEKAEFIKKALSLFSLEQIANLMEKIELPSNKNWLDILLEISKLDDAFKHLIVKDQLNLHVLKFFKFLSPTEKTEFLEMINLLNLSFSEQRDVLEKLLDLKRRLDLPSLLTEELKEALKQKDFNQRRKIFLERLKTLYYSNLSTKMLVLKPLLGRIQKGGVTVKQDPYLEKKEIELAFKIKSTHELSEKIKFLTENKSVLEQILETI